VSPKHRHLLLIETVASPRHEPPATGRQLETLPNLRTRQRTVRVAEAEAAAYVKWPVKAIPIEYFPAAGAVVTTDATPEASVSAVPVTPLRVNVTDIPEMGALAVSFSVAERVIAAPATALVGPV
jgi:hypothetical protein